MYDIRRSNVLQAISPVVAVPIGSESSRGLEASGDVQISPKWVVNANIAYTDAKYGQFAYVDANGNLIDASGNRIPNAPKVVANAWTSYTEVFGIPLELGAGLRYVGKRKGDIANQLTFDTYTTINTYATYRITPHVAASIRVDNLTDKAYATASDIGYSSEVILARPRYFQFDVRAHF